MTTEQILIKYGDILQRAVNEKGFKYVKEALLRDGLVIEILRSGYTIKQNNENEKVLRPAQVKVLKLKEEQIKDIFDI